MKADQVRALCIVKSGGLGYELHKFLDAVKFLENELEELNNYRECEKDTSGVNLAIVFKAIKEGFYFTDAFYAVPQHVIPEGQTFIGLDLNEGCLYVMWASQYEDSCHVEQTFWFNEYGTKWSLKKEDLKK